MEFYNYLTRMINSDMQDRNMDMVIYKVTVIPGVRREDSRNRQTPTLKGGRTNF